MNPIDLDYAIIAAVFTYISFIELYYGIFCIGFDYIVIERGHTQCMSMSFWTSNCGEGRCEMTYVLL